MIFFFFYRNVQLVLAAAVATDGDSITIHCSTFEVTALFQSKRQVILHFSMDLKYPYKGHVHSFRDIPELLF